MNRKRTYDVFAALFVFVLCYYGCTTTLPKAKLEQIKRFLKTVVADTVEKDYQSNGLHIQFLVTDLSIEKIEKTETAQDIVYAVQGRVSYIIRGKEIGSTRKATPSNLVRNKSLRTGSVAGSWKISIWARS